MRRPGGAEMTSPQHACHDGSKFEDEEGVRLHCLSMANKREAHPHGESQWPETGGEDAKYEAG